MTAKRLTIPSGLESIQRVSLYTVIVLICSCVLFTGTVVFSDELPVCSGCHKKQSEGKNLHPIIKTSGCVACHTSPHSKKAKAQKFLSATGIDLCWQCHDKAKFTDTVKHPPVAQGQCLLCHDVHVSENPRLLISRMPDLCFTCHDKTRFTNRNTHPPVAGGMCTSCHDPHSSKVKKLLISGPPDLCFACHEKKIFSGKKTVHAPVKGGLCPSCHEPHASAEKKLLVKQSPELCFSCHRKADFDGKKVVHSPVAGGMCTSCHAAHQSDAVKLLLAKVPDLCFTCHDKKEFTRKNVHSPVAAGTCMSCHSPHTADANHLLPINGNNFCLKCHSEVIMKPHAIAGFLGYSTKKGHPLETKKVKVVDGKKIKLSCLSCHSPHSSEWIRLFKYEADVPGNICNHCHRKK